MRPDSTFAVVTGASRGLGKAFAIELARRGFNLILISLPGDKLPQVAKEISKLNVKVVYYELDLTQISQLENLTSELNRLFDIKILINNVGIGGGKHFLESDTAYLENMIDVNVRATVLLTHQLLANLLNRKESFVLNVASLAALTPMPYKTVYPATKAFIHSFTLSLRAEFMERGVCFSVVHPGPMSTNDDISARIAGQSQKVKMMVIPTERVARISISKLFKKKGVIKLNWFHRLVYILIKIVTSSASMPIIKKSTKHEAKPYESTGDGRERALSNKYHSGTAESGIQREGYAPPKKEVLTSRPERR